MRITTWNINSVRLRLGLVERFLETVKPDILCLQETKCQNDQFPAKAFANAGYPHQAIHGQRGYHGVATLSRLPLHEITRRQYCGKDDARHIAVTLEEGIVIHNFYVPAGGDIPDPEQNEKFDHKLRFVDEMREVFTGLGDQPHILVGDLNIAPHENDVWSHKQLLKVVSHTPPETERLAALMEAAPFIDVMRELTADEQKLYTWWSYRSKDWRKSNRGRRLDHIWVSPALKDRALAKGRRAFTVHDDVRGWDRPSDHAPVTLDL
ncbi:exodeoxyribonuclease III [Parvularcula bermudensis HTCC2503]|uniref:Exodeoxyribonuclease III n=1 Tax=Parvularcula bermudensis (strain ATCC BAA-594 / HTCC2503 / KCTC 12087) TaxID=314260 RepID=E0TEL2_PARBH|nr:exodeoxyribonuclease III [Parvularcula bermudensis]ADM08895.1 exodeoxyribonuclease III [Parvularcula bermudensis HTCC2503]